MASGSSGPATYGSKGFDFGTDDILCSYEDYGTNNQDSTDESHSDPVIISNSSKVAVWFDKALIFLVWSGVIVEFLCSFFGIWGFRVSTVFFFGGVWLVLIFVGL